MTSIEKLFEDYKLVGMLTTAMVNHYQEMHKAEIIKAFDEGMHKQEIVEAYCNGNDLIGAEQYYQETFKKD